MTQPLDLNKLPPEARARIEALDKEQNPQFYQGKIANTSVTSKTRRIKVKSRSAKGVVLYVLAGGLGYLMLGLGWALRYASMGATWAGDKLHEVKHGFQ